MSTNEFEVLVGRAKPWADRDVGFFASNIGDCEQECRVSRMASKQNAWPVPSLRCTRKVLTTPLLDARTLLVAAAAYDRPAFQSTQEASGRGAMTVYRNFIPKGAIPLSAQKVARQRGA